MHLRPDIRVALTAILALSACQGRGEAPPPGEAAATDPLPIVAIAAKPDSEWVHFLPDLLPAIRTCAARTPGAGPFVTKAWPMNHGRLAVRTATRDGRRYECLVQDFTDSVVVEAFDELAPDAGRVPGERHPVFLLPGVPLLTGECWVWEQAEDSDGRVLGVLGYSIC